MAIRRIRVKKRIKYFIFIFLLLVIIIIYILPKNYQKNYKVDEYLIQEQFDKKINNYYFKISNNDYIYDLNINNKYITSRNLIKSISTYQEDDEVCIVLNIKSLTSVPLCKKNDNAIDFHLVSNNMKQNFLDKLVNDDISSTSYNNINIYNLLNRKYLVWNYKELEYMDKTGNSSIDLFDNDYYNIDLATSINNYFVIPNYDQGYTFNELIIFNTKNKKKSIWKINYNISKNSYIVGVYDKSIYLVDNDNKIEYEIVPHAKKIRIVGTENHDGIIYDNGLKKIDFNLLLQNKLSFSYGYATNYELDGGKLVYKTQNNSMVVSNYNIKSIVYSNNYEVYYLIGDGLYHFDIIDGEQKVMQNFEWNFNYDNVIFPY